MTLTLDQLQQVLTALPDPLFVITESGQYAAVIGGDDPDLYHDGGGLAGRSLYSVLPPDRARWFMAQVKSVLVQQSPRTVEYCLAGDEVEGLDASAGPAGTLWFEGRVAPLPFRIEGEAAVVWIARNVTQRHDMEEELRRIGEIDDLTGACTRHVLFNALQQRFQEFRRYRQPLSLLMFDIDLFKTVNDNHGHVVGDRVLQAVCELCREHLRESDLFCRFGGEEFLILLPQTEIEEAKVTADRLRKAVSGLSIQLDELALGVTISLGIACFSPSDERYESIIQRVDRALYAAKRQGRNRVVVQE